MDPMARFLLRPYQDNTYSKIVSYHNGQNFKIIKKHYTFLEKMINRMIDSSFESCFQTLLANIWNFEIESFVFFGSHTTRWTKKKRNEQKFLSSQNVKYL